MVNYTFSARVHSGSIFGVNLQTSQSQTRYIFCKAVWLQLKKIADFQLYYFNKGNDHQLMTHNVMGNVLGNYTGNSRVFQLYGLRAT